MKVLLLHPEDELLSTPWASISWDRVIDVGKTGATDYAKASAHFGVTVGGLDELCQNFQLMRTVRELFNLGMGRLQDTFGLDWWELISIEVEQRLETVIRLRKLMESFDPQDEVHVSRPGFHADVLRLALGSRLHTFSPTGKRGKRGAQHYLRLLKEFPLPQLLEILWDKTDPGYQFRGAFSRRPNPLTGAVVLLPSSYINVSRTAAAYAEILPDTQFLLVATRRSGWLNPAPANVATTWLRRYASVRNRAREVEYRDLMKRWDRLREELNSIPELGRLVKLGAFDDFRKRIERGLEIRDAWRNVLDREPVQAVICADDSNPATRIALLLAAQRGLATIACHHGALDGRYLFKRNHADLLLAKGKMEQDYLVRVCGISQCKVEIGAPALPPHLRLRPGDGKQSAIVFFSEPYEMAGGRTAGLYQDVLPRLADLAIAEQRGLIIKLHPAENFSQRSGLAGQILRPEQLQVTRVIGGPLQPELLSQARFGVTVLSSVAVECALREIPCFLCAWLEPWPYGYVEQFARFGVGIRLSSADEIQRIPVFLQSFQPIGAARENCWTSIEAERLRFLLAMDREPATLFETRAEKLA